MKGEGGGEKAEGLGMGRVEWRFWDKRPDGMVLDKEEKVCY